MVVAGALVLLGTVPVEALGHGIVRAIINNNPGWWLVAFGLAVVGIMAQMKSIGEYVPGAAGQPHLTRRLDALARPTGPVAGPGLFAARGAHPAHGLERPFTLV